MIGLIDIDGKLPNLALMKISSYYKSIGEQVEFFNISNAIKYDKIYASTIFTWNRMECLKLKYALGDKLIIGGSGWDFQEIDGKLVQTSCSILPGYIENSKPDFELYPFDMIYKNIVAGIRKKETSIEKANLIRNMGLGFLNRGCSRSCSFCIVKDKEGSLKRVSSISEILNPRSNVVTILDNNITADPDCIDIFKELIERKLIVNISQGIDIRLIDDEKAFYISKLKHIESIHYAWDLIDFESQVLHGVETLIKYAKPYRHRCFVLVGYNTTFEEDQYRVEKLISLGVKPYIMIYNRNLHNDMRLKHYARWINSHTYKVCKFDEYKPWKKHLNSLTAA